MCWWWHHDWHYMREWLHDHPQQVAVCLLDQISTWWQVSFEEHSANGHNLLTQLPTYMHSIHMYGQQRHSSQWTMSCTSIWSRTTQLPVMPATPKRSKNGRKTVMSHHNAQQSIDAVPFMKLRS
jgi:hypothetical protein